jgi:hypothetical protein
MPLAIPNNHHPHNFDIATKTCGHGPKIRQTLVHLIFRQSNESSIIGYTNFIKGTSALLKSGKKLTWM